MGTNLGRLQRATWLYHFTDKRNIPLIWELGGLWSTAQLRAKGVTFHPGGNQHSLDADTMVGMDKYVHLCFTQKHPMAHIAVNGHGTIEKLQWIYVDNAHSVFEVEGVLYSHEVANKSGVEPQSLEYAREHFDAEALYDFLDWNIGDHYARRKAVEKCEILVPDHLPLEYLKRYLPKP